MTKQGFSLLELLIVMAVIVTLGVAGVETYRNFSKGVEISSVGQTIAADLRHMQSKAMIGEGGYKWGVHIVNGADDYYELFSTPTDYESGSKDVIATTTLSRGINFSDPAEGNSKDVVFSKISGTTTATTIGIVSEGQTQTIIISNIGTIY